MLDEEGRGYAVESISVGGDMIVREFMTIEMKMSNA